MLSPIGRPLVTSGESSSEGVYSLATDELQLNTIVTFCGLWVAFTAVVFSNLRHSTSKAVIVTMAAVVVMYALRVVKDHFDWLKRFPWYFYIGAFVFILITLVTFYVDLAVA